MMKDRSPFFSRFAVLCLLLFTFCAPSLFAEADQGTTTNYSFFVAGDMRNFVNGSPIKRLFDGACIAMKQHGPGAFLLSPGDCDPAPPIRATIDQYLGTNYLWYPVAGNHDVETPQRSDWMRQWARKGIPGLVHSGPKGDELLTYSFDYGNSHFVILNEYANGGNLDWGQFVWLQKDLAENHKPLVWISGHIPIEILPDMDTGRIRHKGEAVSRNPERLKQFTDLLQKYHAVYICGHTHDSSIAKVHGVWQLDSGHCRGAGDTGAPSTFLKVLVNGTNATVEVYRANPSGLNYQIRRTVELK